MTITVWQVSLKITINLAIDPRIRIILYVIWYISIWKMLGFESVYAMENHDALVSEATQSVHRVLNRREYLTPEEIREILETLNNITDPVMIERIRSRINIIAQLYDINLNEYLNPNLQSYLYATQGNSGDVPFEDQTNQTWSQRFTTILLILSLTALAYIVLTNYEIIFNFFGSLIYDTVRNTYRGIGHILTHPNAGPALRDVLHELDQLPTEVARNA